MKGNEGKILLGSLVIAVLIVLAGYKFFYSEDVTKADQVQGEIDNLNVRLTELNEKNANRAMYEAGIVKSQDIIDSVLSIYGPGNSPEKTIMMVVDLCKKTGISVSDITFINDKIVYSSLEDIEAKSNNAEEEKVVYQTRSTGEDIGGVRIFKSGMSIKLSSGYTQLKKIHDYINSNPERMNVETFNVSFNPENGKLEVIMNVNMYSVVDKNHKYEPPVIEDIELENENIFKTIELIPEDEEAEEEKNEVEVKYDAETGDGEENNSDEG